MAEAGPITLLNVDDYAPGLYARSRALRQAGFTVLEAVHRHGGAARLPPSTSPRWSCSTSTCRT